MSQCTTEAAPYFVVVNVKNERGTGGSIRRSPTVANLLRTKQLSPTFLASSLHFRMSRPTTIQLPLLDLSSPPKATPLRARGRSGSIVKVEQVGDRSVEEILDRSAYVNINADWVNAKGTLPVFSICLIPHYLTCRGMAHPRRSYYIWENYHRHRPRHDPANKLDASKPLLSSCMLCPSLTIEVLTHSYLVPALVSHVPLGDRYPI